jgi:hypothetical protein
MKTFSVLKKKKISQQLKFCHVLGNALGQRGGIFPLKKKL